MHTKSDRAALRMRAPRRSDPGAAFLDDACVRTDVELAEILAEEFVASATSGEEVVESIRDATSPEEVGGPFVEEREDEEAE